MHLERKTYLNVNNLCLLSLKNKHSHAFDSFPACNACWIFDERQSRIFHWLLVCKATSSKNSWLRMSCHVLLVKIELIWVRVSADISDHSTGSQQPCRPKAGYAQGGLVAKVYFFPFAVRCATTALAHPICSY